MTSKFGLIIAVIVAVLIVVILINPLGNNSLPSSEVIPPVDGNSLPSSEVIPPPGASTDTPTANTSTNASLVEGPPGILPGKVIKELVPGTIVQGTVTICNNSNEPTSFSVKYRYPDFTKDGYVKASSDAPTWISISDALPMVAAHSYKTITISILVPENVEVPGEKWEFWIGVIDQGQTGMIKAELCQRWLVTMS